MPASYLKVMYRAMRVGCLLVLVMVLSACRSNQPVSGPLERDFKLYAEEPVLSMGPAGSWDSGLMDPGAVVFHDGRFHMFYDAVASFPALIKVGYASSADGIAWERAATEPVFTVSNIGWQPQPTNFRMNSVIVDGDTWVLYFSASDTYSGLTGVVGRATAPFPTGPWSVAPKPVLEPGKTGEWDAGNVGNVDVMHTAEGYRMYYAGAQGIGLATSRDGIAWTKYDDPATSEALYAASDPIIALPAPAGEHDPNVVKTARGWRMVYRSDRGLEYATSADGIRWTLYEEEVLVSSVEDLEARIWYSAFVIHDRTAYLYFEAGIRNTSTYLATWTE